MSSKKSVAWSLRAACTLSGRSVQDWDGKAAEQNYAYRVVEDLHARIAGQAFDHRLLGMDDKEDALLDQVVDALRANVDNPAHYRRHYRGSEPGMFGADGEQVFVDPKHSYGHLVYVAEDTYEGLQGFLQACGLPLTTPRKVLIGCAALLDLDVAMEEIRNGQCWRATWTLYGVTESAQEIQDIIEDDYLRAKRRTIATNAGKAAHKDTNEFKKEVLQAWAEKRFKSIAACARWACRQFPIDADETPKRWIRAYEKALLG
jgi:hypothetical protein